MPPLLLLLLLKPLLPNADVDADEDEELRKLRL
jgi:hypothetical protein